jgi:hypothetical protein
MAEPIDVIVPSPQRIQTDIRALKGDMAALRVESAQHSTKLEAIEGYLTYRLGLTTRNVADIEAIQAQIAEIKRRLEALEARP